MRRALLVVFLLLTLPPAAAAQQQPQEAACDQMRAALAAEPKLAAAHASPALAAALNSPDLLWEFLIAPTTSYLDRLAAAHHGAKLFPPDFLPKIWAALTEAEAIPSVVGESPCHRFEHRIPTIGGRGRSSLLGREVHPGGGKNARPAYPVTLDERNASPWEWQVTRAFGILKSGLSRRYQAPEEYRRLLAQAWDWQRSDELDDETWVRAIVSGPINADLLKAILRLSETKPRRAADIVDQIRSAAHETVGVQAVRSLEWLDRPSPQMKALIQIALTAILQNTKDSGVACAASYSAEPTRTATILALGDWAVRKTVDPWRRYYCYASAICRGIENPPFQADPMLDPANPEVAAALTRFEDWFAANRSRLERRAETEAPELKPLAAELGITLR